MAVGEEIATSFAGSPERRPLVDEVFTRLAARTDAQYSHVNALIAETPEGDVAGVIVAYDGARLHSMRRVFAEVANEVLGYDIDPDAMSDETTPDEIYLDSLAVFPQWRGQGVASKLIAAMAEHYKDAGKPLGLLCDPDNHRARRLYDSLGFKPVGQRPFADVMMDHLQII